LNNTWKRLGDFKEFLVWLENKDIKIRGVLESTWDFGGGEIIHGDIH